ncbi:MAG TPA: hypothetical protein PK661_06595 [Syntrophorhabdaceae bacterium]|jgi:hypothetical protein|nr:hypothetical protein [Syntrophorhabdaceae bacterium]MDI9560384.1 hypothetical protein [Pseudomonadota bacterium]HOS59747.1 hypothetical protein [Syntrophorhabdaceae bacterium]HPH41745.1 hypothetical protein [Syntrophorhabdaceae bacterium]HQI56209.1 hypothetical protein [Syntrophorhabdaceae bacterium]
MAGDKTFSIEKDIIKLVSRERLLPKQREIYMIGSFLINVQAVMK